MPWIPIGIIVIRYSMDSVQRRRESQFSTPMEEQLMNAVKLRIDAETKFKEQIVLSLTQLIENLEECDPSNARTTLDLTQDQLRKIIIKLNDNSNIDSKASETIANIVRDSNLLRRRTALPSPPPSALPPPSFASPLPPPSASPMPPPFVPMPTSSVPANATPKLPLGPITNPGGTGQKSVLPIRTMVRGGKRTRRFRKK